MINKTSDKWEQQIQSGVLAELKGRENCSNMSASRKRKEKPVNIILDYMQLTT